MNAYVGFLKRRFLWALAGLVMFLSYTWIWGEWFVRTMLAVTGLADAEVGAGSLTAGEWVGLVAGSLVVMSPVAAGFLAYVVAWVGWPGRPRPRNPRRLATIGMGLAIAVTAFLLVGLMGSYWPVSSWRDGTHDFARMADLDLANAAWVGDMYFGLLMALIGLYAVVMLCAAFLPPELDPSKPAEPAEPAAPARSPGQGERPPAPSSGESAATGHPTPGGTLDADEFFASRLNPWELEEARKRQKAARKAEERARTAPPSADAAVLDGGDLPVTGIWWPFAVGAVVIVLSLLAALWPYLS